MMKIIHDFFTQNLIWKLASLLFAILLWFIGMNINNPTLSQTFKLALDVRNEEIVANNNYILLNEASLATKIIEVRVRASKNDLTELSRNIKSFNAYIDLKPIDISRTDALGEFMSVNVKCELPSYMSARDFDILSYSPSTVDIMMDKYITKSFVVTVDRIGDAKEGYVSLTPVVQPNKIVVSGAETVVNTIKSVKTSVDLTDVSEDVMIKGKLVAINEKDEEITNVELSVREVEIAVQVDKYGKIAIANPTLVGNVAEGYRVESVTVTPKYIEAVGAEADINSLKNIELETINVDNLSSTKTYPFDLLGYLKDTKLTIKNGTPHEAVVTVNIVKETVKKIVIPVDNLTIKGLTTSVELPKVDVSLIVKGSEKRVSELNANNVSGAIDFTGLEPGVHEVEVQFSLPSDVVQVGKTVVEGVVILDEAATATPETIEDTEGTGDEGIPNEGGVTEPPSTTPTPIPIETETPGIDTP